MTVIQPKPLKVVHIDDDDDTLDQLKSLLSEDNQIDYLNGFVSADDALDFLKKEEVDLVFLDVEMPGHDGLWLAEHIKERNLNIVFVTGHSGYAKQAFEFCALDYLLKPLDADKLQVLLQRIYHEKKQSRQLQTEQIKTLSNYLNPKKSPNKIFINMAGSTSVVKLDEILYFNSKQNYTVVAINNGERQTASKNIKTFEEALKNNLDFLRVSRSYIVNKNFIKSIQRNPKTRSIALMMTNGDLLDTSYKRKEDIIEELM